MVILYFVFGVYLEDYECMFSNFIFGNYNIYVENIFQTTNHFIILRLYQYMQGVFFEWNIYGFILFFYNVSSLILCGLVLYRILWINFKIRSYLFYVVLLYILIGDTFININSARNAFFIFMGAIAYVESCFHENKIISNKKKYIIYLMVIYSILIRFEIILILSLIYLIFSFLRRKTLPISYFSIIVSFVVLILFQINSNLFTPNDERIFIKYEKNIIDKGSINYNDLSDENRFFIDALLQEQLVDYIHFDERFYQEILYQKGTLVKKIKVFSREYLNAFNMSKNEFKNSWKVMLCAIFSMLYVIFSSKSNRNKKVIIESILLCFPMSLLSFTMLPARFLIPYFTVFLLFNIFVLALNKTRFLNIFLGFILILFVSKNSTDKIKYENKLSLHNQVMSDLNKLNNSTPYILYSFSEELFSPLPLSRIKKQNAYFLNLFLFTGWGLYKKPWQEFCKCNPLSIESKLEYIVNKKLMIIMNNRQASFLKVYCNKILNRKLQTNKIKNNNIFDAYTLEFHDN